MTDPPRAASAPLTLRGTSDPARAVGALGAGGHAIADTDYGARGPQSTRDAQIPVPAGFDALDRESPTAARRSVHPAPSAPLP